MNRKKENKYDPLSLRSLGPLRTARARAGHFARRSYAASTPLILALLAAWLFSSCASTTRERGPFVAVRTVAGAAAQPDSARFSETFGIAATTDGTVYVSDGDAGRIWKLAPDGVAHVLAENLNTPSALALSPDQTLVVAETGAHSIKRVDTGTGRVTLVAGVENRAGYADGPAREALFNAPVGVAVAGDGTIFVADTYNDRIRAIDAGGQVRTIAGGGEPSFADAPTGEQARFDTPCGVAVERDGTVLVADTGNHRLRRVSPGGAVTTVAGSGARAVHDAPLLSASFNEPTSVAVDEDGAIYVADAGGSAVRVIRNSFWPKVYTLAGRTYPGLADGPLDGARLSRPSGIAISPTGTLYIADAGNRLVRAVAREGDSPGAELTKEAARALRPRASDFRAQAPPRWPYEPPERPREIAATFGEVRGEIGEGKDAWFHNGLDIPGAYGETARLVRPERVLRPLSVGDFGGARENVRFPSLGYVHLRVGRDKDNRAFDDERFSMRRAPDGRVTGVRIRRGARFEAGDAVGTLNNQNHVHMIAGPSGSEFNALAALELPGVKDTVAPVIEADGVLLLKEAGGELKPASAQGGEGGKGGGPLTVSGDVRIIVRAYDQMDGNAARRRLGLYRLGYQVMAADGVPAKGFAEPLWTISFESLPDDFGSAQVAYAEGSKSGATGETIFAYVVTNVVRDREAYEGFWHTSELPEGDYILRIFAADFFGNTATRDVAVRVVK